MYTLLCVQVRHKIFNLIFSVYVNDSYFILLRARITAKAKNIDECEFVLSALTNWYNANNLVLNSSSFFSYTANRISLATVVHIIIHIPFHIQKSRN